MCLLMSLTTSMNNRSKLMLERSSYENDSDIYFDIHSTDDGFLILTFQSVTRFAHITISISGHNFY